MKLNEFIEKVSKMFAYTAPEVKDNVIVRVYNNGSNTVYPIESLSLCTDATGNVVLIINT